MRKIYPRHDDTGGMIVPAREGKMKDDDKTLTTRQGHPVADNQSLRSVGERGPATLENYQFIESGSCTPAAPARTAGSKLRQDRR
jgi:hypothetical protein